MQLRVALSRSHRLSRPAVSTHTSTHAGYEAGGGALEATPPPPRRSSTRALLARPAAKCLSAHHRPRRPCNGEIRDWWATGRASRRGFSRRLAPGMRPGRLARAQHHAQPPWPAAAPRWPPAPGAPMPPGSGQRRSGFPFGRRVPSGRPGSPGLVAKSRRRISRIAPSRASPPWLPRLCYKGQVLPPSRCASTGTRQLFDRAACCPPSRTALTAPACNRTMCCVSLLSWLALALAPAVTVSCSGQRCLVLAVLSACLPRCRPPLIPILPVSVP